MRGEVEDLLIEEADRIHLDEDLRQNVGEVTERTSGIGERKPRDLCSWQAA